MSSQSFTGKALHGALLLFTLASCQAVASTLPASPVMLRGYGSITAIPITAGALRGVQFSCDSANHAALMRQKLGRDMEQSATVTPAWVSVSIGGAAFPVLVRPGLGSFLFASSGSTAYALTSTDTANLEPVFAPAASLLAGAEAYAADFSYPMYLDKFDHRGIGSWYPYMMGDKDTVGKPNSIDDHFAYAKKYDLTLQPTGGGALLDNLLPKLHAYDRPYHFAQWQDWSAALAILQPEDLTQPSPDFTSVPSYYGQVSFGAKKLETYRDWEFQQSMKLHVGDDNLVDWLDPNGEIGPFGDYIFWDFSENNREHLVSWLKDHRGYTLASLGEAWYGDARKFAAWNNVAIPMSYDFYGSQPDSIAAGPIWRVHTGDLASGLAKGWQRASYDDAGWVAFRIPGGELPGIELRAAKSTWYRGALTVSAVWLAAHRKSGPIYLNAISLSSARGWQNPDRLWVNGQVAGTPYAAGGTLIAAQVDIASLLHPGKNTIVYLPADAAWGVRGKFFLATKRLEHYPFADSHRNARYVDWKEYVSWCCEDRVAHTLRAMRGIDPNRPIKVHAATDIDLFTPLLAEYGAYAHNTGEGGFLRAWDKRFGYPWGVQSSAEFGGSIEDPVQWKKWLGFFNFEGQNALDNFHDIQSMMYSPCRDLWAEYMPYLKLANRRDIVKPDIALFWSSMNNRLLPQSLPYIYDLGRGDLQSIGYSYVYLDEKGLAAGLAKDYPVLWDCGTAVMTPQTVARLTQYVEAGGTYVAMQDTGRHTPTHRDAWPIEKLTGFHVEQTRPMNGIVTIEGGQPLFSTLAGQTFLNHGLSQDYSGENFATTCLALTPSAPGTEVVARYDDGAVAIGMRRLGKGRVIVLGSPFWRDSYDKDGYWHPGDDQSAFLQDLLAGLGLKPLCTSDNPMIWRENYTANNGAEEDLVLWNQTALPQTANLTWRTTHPATALYDPKNGAITPADISGNTVSLKNVALQPYETLVLVTQTARPPQDDVADWFAHTALVWHASAPGAVLSRPDLPVLQADAHDEIGEQIVDAGGFAKTDPAALSRSWESGGWTAKPDFLLPDHEGIAVAPDAHVLYRCSFVAPASWKPDDRYVLNITPLYPHPAAGSLYLNGTMVFDSTRPAVDIARIDITRQLKLSGKNIFVFVAPAAGFAGQLLIDRQPHANATLSVNGSFAIQSTEDSGLSSAVLPGKFTGLFAVKSDIVVPTSWKGSRIFIRIDPADITKYNSFAINGKVIFHPVAWYPPVTYMDITPWIKFGAPNSLLLLPEAAAKSWTPGALGIDRITLEKVTQR